MLFLYDKCWNCVDFEFQYDDILLYWKLRILLYADDTVVFGNDGKDFQNNLDYAF